VVCPESDSAIYRTDRIAAQPRSAIIAARRFTINQVGVTASSTPAGAATELRAAGDQMLQAIIFHSDHLELSDQFGANSGSSKSASFPEAAAPSMTAARGRQSPAISMLAPS
jgi:hypothetical protein